MLHHCSQLMMLQEILPGTYQPSISHKMVAALERRGSLLRNYTQNIDTLEEVAGITRVEYCHGRCTLGL